MILSLFPSVLMLLYSYVFTEARRVRRRSVWASDTPKIMKKQTNTEKADRQTNYNGYSAAAGITK